MRDGDLHEMHTNANFFFQYTNTMPCVMLISEINRHNDTQATTSLLLGHTNRTTATTSGLGVLTTHTNTPMMSETTMSTDLLQSLQVLTENIVQDVGDGLAVSTVLVIFLTIEQVVGDFVLTWVLNNVHQTFQFIRGTFTGTKNYD